jgi:hypothetical protein
MNFFTPKFMKIRCFVPLLKAPDSQFSMKLAIHGLDAPQTIRVGCASATSSDNKFGV